MKYIIYAFLLSFSSVQFCGVWFNFIQLEKVLAQHESITYLKCIDKLPYKIAPFEIAPAIPSKVIFNELFILTISMIKNNCFVF